MGVLPTKYSPQQKSLFEAQALGLAHMSYGQAARPPCVLQQVGELEKEHNVPSQHSIMPLIPVGVSNWHADAG